MSESALFIVGFIVFGVAIAGTLVGTIAGSDPDEELPEAPVETQRPRVTAQSEVAVENSIRRTAALV